jgi:hypothetical protein
VFDGGFRQSDGGYADVHSATKITLSDPKAYQSVSKRENPRPIGAKSHQRDAQRSA